MIPLRLAEYSLCQNPFHSGISCRPGLVVSVISLFYLSQHLVSIKTNEIDKHRSMLSVEGAVRHR